MNEILVVLKNVKHLIVLINERIQNQLREYTKSIKEYTISINEYTISFTREFCW